MSSLISDTTNILKECLTVFTKDPTTGKGNFSVWSFFFYILFPLAIIAICVYKGYELDDEIRKSILPVLTLFMALVFQVIYIAADKFANRVDKKMNRGNGNSQCTIPRYEDVSNYLIRFGNYTRIFLRQLVLILLLSLFVIVNYMLQSVQIHLLTVFTSSLILASLYLWIILLLKAIVSIYTILMDDINEGQKSMNNN